MVELYCKVTIGYYPIGQPLLQAGLGLEVPRHNERDDGASEKDTVSAQKLGQLQPFVAVFSPEWMGQLASSGPTLDLLRHRMRAMRLAWRWP